MNNFFDSNLFTWVLLPLFIFCARIVDMSLDTLRIIMIGHGRKFLAAFCGFIEVSIWLLVARQVIVNLPNPLCFFAYAGGFATGNYVGMWIEERVAVGFQEVRVVISPEESGLIEELKKRGYGLTIVAGCGGMGPVSLISMIVPRAGVSGALALVRQFSPKAFYSIEDVCEVSQGVFPEVRKSRLRKIFSKSLDA